MKNSSITSLRVSLEINDVTYRLNNVTSTEYNDPLEKNLRASPQGFGSGVPEQSNITAPVTRNLECYEVSSSLVKVLYDAWNDDKKITYKEFSSNTTESMTAIDAIITTNPRNGTKGDGSAEAVNLGIQFTRNNVTHGDV